MTQPEDVLAIMTALESKGIQVWLFGGWAIEAQVPLASRCHCDIDLVVALQDLDRARAVIEGLGYTGRPDPNDPCEHLRFGRCKNGTLVQVASVRSGRSHIWLSVPSGDMWLACPLDALPTEAKGSLLGKAVRCVTAEALLQSKLSWQGNREGERSDILHLKSILSGAEVLQAEANCGPRLRCDCDADCGSDVGAG